MGVRGLTTYVNYHQDVFLKKHNLHNTNLVIDGSSLAAQLYQHSNCFSAFGGDYDKYAAYVRNFFKGLKKCNITSYVIFDGSYEKRKLKTICDRLKSKISGASRLNPVAQSSLRIFPLLLRYVCKEALEDMNVPFTVCEFEADNEIAAMSRKLACPVLSFDSDFFIFNVIYIPFNTLDFKPVPIEKDNQTTHVIRCKIYRMEYLIAKIGVEPNMMPLLATLLGNDYVQKRVFKQFFSQLKLPKTKQKKNDEQRTIQALFKWLENETLATAIEKIIGRLKKNAKKRVLYLIRKSIEGYNCTECPSLKYFNYTIEKTEISPPEAVDTEKTSEEVNDETYGLENIDKDNENSSNSEESSDDGEEFDLMPKWFSNYSRQNIIPATYLTPYTLHMYFCSPQAEDYTDEDACLCVLKIIRYAFDILTDFCIENFTYISREDNNQYRRILVGQEHAISRPIERNYSEMPVEELKIYFQHFLKDQFPNLKLSILDILPANFQLATLSILWWASNCRVTAGNIHSLILSFVMLDCLDSKTGTFRGHHFFNKKFANKLEELKERPAVPTIVDENNLFLNKNKVLYTDSLVACSVLLQHFEISNEIMKKQHSYNTKIMHRFAQFQCVLLQFNCLNCLSNNLFEKTKYSKLFNGTFVYNLACKLENQASPVSYVEQHIKGAYTVILYYKSLCYVIDKCVKQMGIELATSIGKRRRRKKKSKKRDVEEFTSEEVI